MGKLAPIYIKCRMYRNFDEGIDKLTISAMTERGKGKFTLTFDNGDEMGVNFTGETTVDIPGKKGFRLTNEGGEELVYYPRQSFYQ